MTGPGPVARAAELASLGRDHPLTTDEVADASVALADDDHRVRAAALGALVRGAPEAAHDGWLAATADRAAAVRRRAAELAPRLPASASIDALVALLADHDVTVVEAAAWALGELGMQGAPDPRVVEHLARTTTEHGDPLAREAAVAALGALGDEAGLAAVLQATGDRPAVRRRAVLALAPFDGPEVEAAIARALDDKDWQVRQAAEDLTDTTGP